MRTAQPRPGRIGAAALLPILLLAACGKTNQYQPPPPPTVTVSRPLSMPVTDYLQATGSVAPAKSVDLVARVEGYLQSVDFQDGSLVTQGQQLFLIEQDQYQAKLQSNQAQLQNAQSEYERQLRLIKENATSQANVEKWQSQRDQAQAAVTLAKINLGYTRITAPFSGRIGRHLVDPGNLVGGMQSTKLATLDQIDPVFVYFNVNERDVLRVRNAAMDRGEKLGGSIKKLPVFVGLQTESDFPHEGTLDFADNGLNTSSGTIQVRAVLPNKDRVLLPGMFARLRIPLGPPTPTLMVPDRVVGNDQAGSYVLVVGAEHRVIQQRVEAGALQNGLRAVVSGLTPDSEVVVEGLQNAVPGNEVTPVEKSMPAPAAASSSQGS